MVQIGSDTFEDLNPDLLHAVIRGFEQGRPPKPGSQAGRVASCPAPGPTSLMDQAGAYKTQRGTAGEVSNVAFGQMRQQQREDWERAGRAGEGGVGSGLVTSDMVVGDEAVGDIVGPRRLTAPRGGTGR